MSKNDMVRVPLELLKRAIDQLSVCSGPGPANHAQELRAMLDTPARQHQGEPVALPKMADHKSEDRSNPAFCEDEDFACGWNACLDEIAKLGPLYTHADPAEVERLHGKIESMRRKNNEYWHETEALRAKLAEAHALLVRSREMCHAVVRLGGRRVGLLYSHALNLGHEIASLSASAEPSAPICVHGGRCWADEHCGECPHSADDMAALYARKETLSAECQKCAGSGEQDSGGTHPWGDPISVPCDCAEPSAPVEIDERAEFEAWFTDHSKDWPFPSESIKCIARDNDWLVWQARAALERK